jgi:tryptophanyl-tRNA synthetase
MACLAGVLVIVAYNMSEWRTFKALMKNPKNPDTCNVFGLYKLLGSEEQTAQLKAKYLAGNYGFGHAKQELYDLIAEKFKTEREKYNYYINNLEEVDKLLFDGAAKAGKVADGVLKRVREKLGFM